MPGVVAAAADVAPVTKRRHLAGSARRGVLSAAFSEQSKASYRFGRCRSLGRMRKRWRGRYSWCRQAATRRM